MEFADYARVSCAFHVTSELDVDALESQGVFTERAVSPAYVKDYDAIPENRPMDWPTRFDTSTWQLFSAFDGDARVGGAMAIPYEIGREPNASTELWDLRVAPSVRGRGIGHLLFEAVAQWSRERHHPSLVIETQHTNVAACQLYRARGCVIQSITRQAYPSLPNETRIMWRRDLEPRASAI
jgi:ribosomal protein S18 acetylase RimI-like enzyme